MDFLPTKKYLHAFLEGEVEFETQYHVHDMLEDGLSLDAFGYFRKGAKKLVCLMPSALPVGKEKPNPVFHRWSWSYHIKENVVCVNDPTFSIPEIFAGWFIGKGRDDTLQKMSAFVNKLAKKLGVTSENILFYGSSMGGFGALMMASLNKGSLAVAEVPQFDLEKYPFPSSIRGIEQHCLDGKSIKTLAEEFPYVTSVLERFQHQKCIPNLRIITNSADVEYSEVTNFFQWMHKLPKDDFSYIGNINVSVFPNDLGHRPLPTPAGLHYIHEALTNDWGKHAILRARENKPSEENSNLESRGNPRGFEENSKLSYRELIDEAVTLSKQIKFLRTEEEKILYNSIRSKLYAASELNKQADWPLLKICGLEKQWSNSFNNEILQAATEAFSRKQSLEAFIYCARAYLYNFSIQDALEYLTALEEQCSDPQIGNVGNIFKAIVQYEMGCFNKYVELIRTFNQNKASEFNPYIAIPVSTVYTSNEYAPAEFSERDIKLGGVELRVVREMDVNHASYIVSISCDKNYFSLYGKYIVQSFNKFCSSEAVLHISLLDGGYDEHKRMVETWGGKNVHIIVNPIPTEINKGPIASLLRFTSVYPLIQQYSLPVLVLDLDTVIKRSFVDLVTSMNTEKVDLLSRVLSNGMAPWEKYTGGFAFFNSSETGKRIARSIAYVGSLTCKTDVAQWWIDQNVFESGIRECLINGANLSIKNIYSLRDRYCVMPVGTKESKTYVLERALNSI